MTLGRYLAGLALLVLTIAPVALASIRLRRWLVPDWMGAAARLAEAVLALALLLFAAHLTGTLGLFRPLPLLLAAVLCWGLVAWLVPEPHPGPGGTRKPPRVGLAGMLLAAAGTAVVVGQWGPGLVDALDEGMYGSDTLRYHGPVAARFVQEHGVPGLHFLLNDPTLTFFPFDSELLHAVGIVFMGSDVLSPLLNMGWLALALLAAWCVGRPYGLGPATLLLVALVLASPALAQSQPGSGDNDIVALALLLAAVALLLEWEGRWQPVALAGVAAGIALGTKLTVFGVVGAVTVGLALVARSERKAVMGAWLGALLAAGGFWYARNLFAIGNPLPWFGFGPLGLPSPPFLQDPSVAHYITDTHIWRTVYFPGFHDRFGSVWVVMALLALAGIALAVISGASRMHRMLGAVGALGLVAYALAPNTAAGPEGFPIFFSATARYAAPAFALGLVLLPLVPWLRPLAGRAWVQAVLLVLVLATLTNQGIEPLDAARALAALACVGLIAMLAWAPRPLLAVALGVLALVLAAAGWRVTDGYLQDRYATGSLAFARGIDNSRVALVGSSRQYHLYGTDLSNHVQYVGRKGPDGAFGSVRSCREWRRALDEGGYEYVVITPANELFGTYTDERPPELGWTRSAAASIWFREPGGVTVFGLDGPLGAAGCRG